MPINAHPEYFAAQGKYHEAETPAEKLKALEEMLRTAPSHKGAESLRAELKQRLSKLRSQMERQNQQKSKGANITVKKEGAAQVAIVSMTNAGKSSLLAKMTNAKPEITEHEYSTTKVELGILNYKGVNIQMLEIPSVYKDFAYKGLGPTYFSIIRNVDLIIFVIDLTKNVESQKKNIEDEFEKANIKINKEEPPIIIKRVANGGIVFRGKEYLDADMDEVMKLMRDSAVHNADVAIYDKTTLEQVAEALDESVSYKRAIYVYNKSDIAGKKGISAKTGAGLEELKDMVWNSLGLIKVFTKTPGKPKDLPPIALDKGSTIKDLAEYVHKDFLKKFKYARIWGKSAKFKGQMQGKNHELADDDIVELHLK